MTTAVEVRRRCRTVLPVLLIGVALACGTASAASAAPASDSRPANHPRNRETIVTKGVAVTFEARPHDLSSPEPREGEYADISFSVKDASTGDPIPSLAPGAWMDLTKAEAGKGPPLSCKEKVEQFLRGGLNYRPTLDLTSYYLLVMNKDPSISVIDPVLGLRGITHLYTMVLLQSPGEDWVKSRDGRALFVSMPRVGKVAVVDTDSFRVVKNLDTGGRPVRAALQPDGKYLWVGDDAEGAGESGVTVIDAVERVVRARIATGAGHHEIAFSDDARYAYVSNLESGTVSVIDVRRLEKVRDVSTGPAPTALSFSSLAKSLYVADGRDGTITVVDGQRHERVARLAAAPGLNAIAFSPGQRFAIALSGTGNRAFVVDASTNRVVRSVDTDDRPYQVAFTDAFAYIRCLGSELVTLLPLQTIESEGRQDVKKFAAGTRPPGRGGYVGVAATVARAVGEAAVVVTNTAENSIYYYMEGMAAPMGSFRNYGHELKAVEVVDRSLKERSPGVYSTSAKIPLSGTYDVVFFLDAPVVIHCFRMEAGADPAAKPEAGTFRVEYSEESPILPPGRTGRLRFRLLDPTGNAPLTGLTDLVARITLATGRWQGVVRAEHKGDGFYEAVFPAPPAGVYVVTLECPSLHVRADQVPPLTMRVAADAPPTPSSGAK